MGTGILSIGLSVTGHETVSLILLGLDVVLWLGLGLVFGRRWVRHRRRWLDETRSPAGLTAIAGTAVFGARIALLGTYWAAYVLLVLALCLWLRLVPAVLRGWTTPTVGVSFVLAVATESLALLSALLALQARISWLVVAALVPLVLGLLFYVFVLARFDIRQLAVGCGDHWVTGGALAIATLACARAAEAAGVSPSLDGLEGVLEDAALALWLAAMAWLPVLVCSEIVWRRLSYDTRRWSTVFPVGMYAVCSYEIGSLKGIRAVVEFARVWIWIALAVWAVVALAMTRRGLAVATGSRR